MQSSQRPHTYTLITGASSGLGKALAFECASRNMDLILVALPNDGLKEVKQELQSQFPIKTRIYELDLSDSQRLDDLIESIQYLRINCVINNLGVGGTTKLVDTTEDSINQIIDLNIRVTSLITYRLLPELKQHGDSHIINIGSLLAGYPVAYKSIYPASKSFVYSFTLGLREELKNSSVCVSIALPGPMKTNPELACRLMKKQGRLAKAAILSPAKVAKIIMDQSLQKDALIIPGWVNKFYWFLMKMIPLWWGLPFLSNVYRKELPSIPERSLAAEHRQLIESEN